MQQIPVKILYIEDSQKDFQYIRKMIAGFVEFETIIDWNSNRDKALENLNNNNYDVCLLGQQIAAKSGLDFLKSANAFNLLTPVVFLADSSKDTNIAMAMEAGACDYLIINDIDSSILERTIRHVIERKKYEFKIVEVTDELAIALKDIKNNQNELIEIENLKSVKALAGAIAHEFSQPLQALTNYLSLIRSAESDTIKYVDKAEDMIVRIAGLTDNLRNITGLPKRDYLGSQILDIKLKAEPQEQTKNKVLIVDDEEVILETLVDMFEIRGFECDGTTNAKEALELIKQNDYDLIISDVSMPIMSGPDFFKQVKAMNIKSTFIFITGYEVPDKIMKIIKQADGLIVKPISFDQFFNNIEQLESA